MAIHFNEKSVPALDCGVDAKRQRLLTAERVAGTNLLLDRFALGAGGVVEVEVPAGSLAWFAMLEGEATLGNGAGRKNLSPAHVGFLPEGYRGTLESPARASLLYVEIPDAARFDGDFAGAAVQHRIVNWTTEPVLHSQHDARRRIYVATPRLFGTTAMKAEMIIYPPGTSGSNHHHEGCEHFKYILSGRGTGYTNEEPHSLAAGDVVYHYDRERHYSQTEGSEDMKFIEFFVPGVFNTVWVDESRICTWLPSGRNVQGGQPAREIRAHSSADLAIPRDI